MTLHEYRDVEQGTEEWHDLRRGVVTASIVGKLVTPTLKVASNDASRAIVATLVAERLTGHTEDTPMSSDMWRGVECEPIAREKYAEVNGVEVDEIGFMIRDLDGGQLGYSPDGLVGDDGLIEIKSPRAKGHITTVDADRVPPCYMAQCQAGLLVSGRKWLDFVSFHGGLPLWTKRVYPDPAWHAAITEAVHAFEKAAEELADRFLTATKGLPATERVAPFNEVELKL